MDKINNYYTKNYKKLFYIYLNIFILLLLLILSFFFLENLYFINKWTDTISVITLILFLFHCIQIRNFRLQYYDFRVWFILLLYLFMFGRILLHSIELENYIFWNLMDRFPDELLYETSLYIICFIQSIFIGIIFFNNSKKSKGLNKLLQGKSEKEINKLVLYTGIILSLFAFPFRLYIDLKNIIGAKSSGSYTQLSHVGLMDDFAYLFIPGIIGIISGSKRKSIFANIIFITVILYFILTMLLTGDRRYPVTGIIALVLSYMTKNNIKIKIFKLLSIIFSSIIFLNILTIIRKIRLGNLDSIISIISTYGNDLFSLDVVYETLSEFGLSFFSVVQVIQNVPEVINYLYGLTFVGSILSLLPIGFLLGDFFKQISISNVVNQYHTGASLIGDMYANFGWFGILGGFLVGIILSKLFYFGENIGRSYYILRYYSLFYILINLVRSSFLEIFRLTFIVLFVPIIIIYLLRTWKKFNTL